MLFLLRKKNNHKLSPSAPMNVLQRYWENVIDEINASVPLVHYIIKSGKMNRIRMLNVKANLKSFFLFFKAALLAFLFAHKFQY